MITQEDIDAMDELEAREVMWGGERKLLTDRIEQLDRELAASRRDFNSCRDALDRTIAELAEEKALSDRLAASYSMSLNDKAKVKACPSLFAYRKARGL